MAVLFARSAVHTAGIRRRSGSIQFRWRKRIHGRKNGSRNQRLQKLQTLATSYGTSQMQRHIPSAITKDSEQLTWIVWTVCSACALRNSKKLSEKNLESFLNFTSMEHMGRKVTSVRLFKKTVKIRNDMYEIMQKSRQFQQSDYETQTAFYTAYDSLKVFLDNLQ